MCILSFSDLLPLLHIWFLYSISVSVCLYQSLKGIFQVVCISSFHTYPRVSRQCCSSNMRIFVFRVIAGLYSNGSIFHLNQLSNQYNFIFLLLAQVSLGLWGFYVACLQMRGRHSCSLPLVVQLYPQVDWLTCILGSQLYARYKL